MINKPSAEALFGIIIQTCDCRVPQADYSGFSESASPILRFGDQVSVSSVEPYWQSELNWCGYQLPITEAYEDSATGLTCRTSSHV